MLRQTLALATFLPIAFAFSDTVPIVAWSSHKSSALDVLPSAHKTSPHAGAVFESILFDDDACSNDAVVLVDQPGLHASDLRTLSPTSPLTTLLHNSPSSVQLPYVKRAEGAPSIQDIAELVSKRCGSRALNFMAGQGGVTYEKGSKHVMCVSMPHLEGDATHIY
ncbi:hypothetical protein EWM64_g10182 [Hericium alpestre]|uniref:Protein BIG1 n=1 Tax=Hericium alpestre TaxID=135208 RepID=A0A4Y9ZI13_9AGAM|nr:hypothetical protein EWM64_g10182 [Hericium alpestre]